MLSHTLVTALSIRRASGWEGSNDFNETISNGDARGNLLGGCGIYNDPISGNLGGQGGGICQSMKLTAPLRCNLSVFGPTPCCGLSVSR
jgi:hypothetical protein